MTWDAKNVSFVRFDRYFSSKLRCLLLKENPTIPKALIDFIKPMDNPSSLQVSHNWGNIIPYSLSTIIRVDGFQGTPHVFPSQMPLKIGIAMVLW